VLSHTGLPCQYGELPGRWRVREGDNYSTWHTLSDACPLADRVAEYGVALSDRQATQPSAYKLNLLMYGDSIDRCVCSAPNLTLAQPLTPMLTFQA